MKGKLGVHKIITEKLMSWNIKQTIKSYKIIQNAYCY